jgi:hypothetical protein
MSHNDERSASRLGEQLAKVGGAGTRRLGEAIGDVRKRVDRQAGRFTAEDVAEVERRFAEEFSRRMGRAEESWQAPRG